MIVSTTTGKSMFDHFLHSWMTNAGVDKNYIGNFSIWGITSNQGWNLILTEALSSVMSFGIGTGAKLTGRLAGRLGSYLGVELAGGRLDTLVKLGTKLKSMTGSLLKRFGTSFDEILELGWTRGFEKLSKMSTRRAIATVVMKSVTEYFDLVGEVIFEMAFDSMLRFDKSERPWGGGEIFIAAMSLSIITSSLLKVHEGRGFSDTVIKNRIVSFRFNRCRLASSVTTVALHISMTAMRIPVIIGNAK